MACAAIVAAPQGSPTNQCLVAAHAAGVLVGIPPGLMERIAQVESAQLQTDGIWRPWPWSIDADAQSYAFATEDAAVAWAAAAPARGVKSLDAGCLQVNQQAHPHAFSSLRESFDPWPNALYAAHYLRDLYENESSHDWSVAVGLYHSHTPQLAEEYRTRVAELGAGIIAGLPPATVAARLAAVGALRLHLANGGTLRILLNRQPAAPGHRRLSPCAVARALGPELAVAPHLQGCGR